MRWNVSVFREKNKHFAFETRVLGTFIVKTKNNNAPLPLTTLHLQSMFLEPWQPPFLEHGFEMYCGTSCRIPVSQIEQNCRFTETAALLANLSLEPYWLSRGNLISGDFRLLWIFESNKSCWSTCCNISISEKQPLSKTIGIKPQWNWHGGKQPS